MRRKKSPKPSISEKVLATFSKVGKCVLLGYFRLHGPNFHNKIHEKCSAQKTIEISLVKILQIHSRHFNRKDLKPGIFVQRIFSPRTISLKEYQPSSREIIHEIDLFCSIRLEYVRFKELNKKKQFNKYFLPLQHGQVMRRTKLFSFFQNKQCLPIKARSRFNLLYTTAKIAFYVTKITIENDYHYWQDYRCNSNDNYFHL